MLASVSNSGAPSVLLFLKLIEMYFSTVCPTVESFTMQLMASLMSRVIRTLIASEMASISAVSVPPVMICVSEHETYNEPDVSIMVLVP